MIKKDEERERLAGFNEENFSQWDADFMVKEQEKLYKRLATHEHGSKRIKK
jgi:hypothetical protein